MTLQGAKWATFGEKRYQIRGRTGAYVAVDIPSRGTVTVASSRKPYLGLEIELGFRHHAEGGRRDRHCIHCTRQTEGPPAHLFLS